MLRAYIFTACIRRMGKVMFLRLFTPGWVPRPGEDGRGYPSQIRMGYPGQVRTGGMQPGQDEGYPGQVRTGGTPARSGWVYPGQGWGTPHPGMGYPPLQDRTADGVLDAWRAVCLLRSCKRTFLFTIIFLHNYLRFAVFVSRTQMYSFLVDS